MMMKLSEIVYNILTIQENNRKYEQWNNLINWSSHGVTHEEVQYQDC